MTRVDIEAHDASPLINKKATAFQKWQLVLAGLLIVQMVQFLMGIGEYSRPTDTLPTQALHIISQIEDAPAFNSTTVDLLNRLSLSAALPAFGDFPACRAVRPVPETSTLKCGMHNCFDLERCRDGVMVYIYPDDPEMKNPTDSSGPWGSYSLLKNVLKDHFRIVTDPEEACVFLPPYETSCEINICSFNAEQLDAAFAKLPYWNNGQNHLILFYGNDYEWPPFNIGQAILLSTSMVQQSYRPGYDVMLPYANLINRKPYIASRDLLLYFQGGIYTSPECMDRGRHLKMLTEAAEKNEDVILLGKCFDNTGPWGNAPIVDTPDFPEVCRSCQQNASRCTGWKRNMPVLRYKEGLYRAKFGWAPRGCGPLSYRLIEIITTGGVPVQTGDDVVLPFQGDDTGLSRAWRQCVIFPSESSLPFLIDGLRSMTDGEYNRRLSACGAIVRSRQNYLDHVLWLGLCSIASRVKNSIVNLDISQECKQVLDQFSEFR